MPDTPRSSLTRVLEDLGVTLLEVVHGDPTGPGEIGSVAIHDAVDPPPLPAHALVLGVGLHSAPDLVRELDRLGRDRALALVVRAPVPLTPAVRAAADRAGVCLLALSRGVPWAHLAALLRSLLAEGEVGTASPDSLGGLPAGDLFAVANAIAALMDAPVTIEDRRCRVLAFSGRQNEADASRVETILGRHVPDDLVEILRERGVFRRLYRSDEPVYVDPVQFGSSVPVPRVAICVRAGDEVLGSIWVAMSGRLSEARAQALGDAAKLVALHVLRARAGADVQRRLRADLVSTSLAGGVGARAALERLGLAGVPLVVLGLTTTGQASQAVAEQERLADAFAMHLGATHPRSATALIGGVVYALLPSVAAERATGLVQDFLDRVGERLAPVAAIGPPAQDVTGLVQARSATDRILRVLRESPRERRVARLEEVQAESLLLELRDQVAARGDGPGGALARLIEYDAAHDGNLVGTARAWLDAFGDVAAAAAAMYVHPNTFRYRLRRVATIGGIDLADAEQRFGLMLQIRLYQ